MRVRQKRADTSRKIFTIKRFFIFSVVVFSVCILGAIIILLKHFLLPQAHTIVDPAVAELSVDDLSAQLKANNISFDSIKTTDGGDTYTIQLTNGPSVIFSRIKDVRFQVRTLIEILSKLSIDNKQPVSIEFQYNQPIVKF